MPSAPTPPPITYFSIFVQFFSRAALQLEFLQHGSPGNLAKSRYPPLETCVLTQCTRIRDFDPLCQSHFVVDFFESIFTDLIFVKDYFWGVFSAFKHVQNGQKAHPKHQNTRV